MRRQHGSSGIVGRRVSICTPLANGDPNSNKHFFGILTLVISIKRQSYSSFSRTDEHMQEAPTLIRSPNSYIYIVGLRQKSVYPASTHHTPFQFTRSCSASTLLYILFLLQIITIYPLRLLKPLDYFINMQFFTLTIATLSFGSYVLAAPAQLTKNAIVAPLVNGVVSDAAPVVNGVASGVLSEVAPVANPILSPVRSPCCLVGILN